LGSNLDQVPAELDDALGCMLRYNRGVFGKINFYVATLMSDGQERKGADDSDEFAAAMKINEVSLVPNLLFAFFGHLPEYKNIADRLSTARSGAIDDLIQILNRLFIAVREAEFDRKGHAWITDEVIEDNFRNRDFNQYYPAIRKEKVNFRTPKSAKLRVNLAALASLARDIFASRPPVSVFIDDLRSQLKIDPRDGCSFNDQFRVLTKIEETARSIDHRPGWPISFDDGNRPVIKTDKPEFFPTHGEVIRDQLVVEGSFIVFRRVLQISQRGKPYIREYLQIQSKQFGLTFRWQSRGGDRNDVLIFNGVGFFTKGALWLIGHTSKHLPRIRVLAADVVDWEEHEQKRKDFCTARLLTHKHEAKRASPAARPLLLKRDRPAFWAHESFDERCRFLTKAEVKKMLSVEEMKIIDGKE
jgi:hypothetical protein